MKVLIVDTVSYNRAPYLKYYIDACENNDIDYDLFLWNRDKEGGIKKERNIYTMNSICPFGGSKLKKLFPMLRYRNALLRIIEENKYTHLILINTLCAVMIARYVLKRYQGKYILDIRDYTYEKINQYKNIEKKLIENSYFTTISSRGFFEFIDRSDKIIINHNISNQNQGDNIVTFNKSLNITIGFVGSVRYPKVNKQLIRAIKNNSRYTLKYIGPEVDGCDLREFCELNNIQNVIFEGEFVNSNKNKIYKSIDVINSLYGDSSLEVTTAIPNRYYDALIFKKPIIASKGTYLAKLVEKNRLGFSIDIMSENFCDILNDYLKSFDENKFIDSCDSELNSIINEQNNFLNQINIFLKNSLDG